MINLALNLNNFDLSIFKKNTYVYIYIYNVHYCCCFKINKKIKIKNRFSIEICNQNSEGVNLINLFVKQFFLCQLSKIKFTGKGYKIKKNTKNSLILLFNRSHLTSIWWKNIFIKKLKKYKIIVKYTPINSQVINTIINVRPINLFTKKGLRISRQILLKKKGKK